MSRSLNSDYLDQLLIRADTSRLDGRLVAHAAIDRPLPEEEQALLVFKRGWESGLDAVLPALLHGVWCLLVCLVPPWRQKPL